MTRPEPPDLDRSAHICAHCSRRADTECSHPGCLDSLCGGIWDEQLGGKGHAITCEECSRDFCPMHAVETDDGFLCRECSERADYIRQHKGEKCDCVSGTRMDGGGPELAAEDCDVCHGTGRIGETEFEDYRRDAA